MVYIKLNKLIKGFTLVELLVVISIIGVLMSISVFAVQSSRKSSRDAIRKSDLETIRSGLEIYKSDCNEYPDSLTFGSSLTGDGESSLACEIENEYISEIPNDPLYSQENANSRTYDYIKDTENSAKYIICASLENIPAATPLPSEFGTCSCGSSDCNYIVENP